MTDEVPALGKEFFRDPIVNAPGTDLGKTVAINRDAARFQYLQSIPAIQAQAFFWRYPSRRDRAKAIDIAMAQHPTGDSA